MPVARNVWQPISAAMPAVLAAADHAPGVGLVHGAVGQPIGFVAARGAEQPALAVLGDAGRIVRWKDKGQGVV